MYGRTSSKPLNQRDLTEDDALLNARLARILQASDYDFINQTTKLLGSLRHRL